MNRASGQRSTWVAVLLMGTIAFPACQDPKNTPLGPGEGVLASASGNSRTTSLAVTAANPAFGRQGQVGEAVTITGSGFVPGARASWQRSGVTDTNIVVLSTQYVSSTQLLATIDISTGAAISYYDIVVTQDRTKGIGSESAIGGQLFEVTQAIVIAGAGNLRGVNDNGEITGNGGPLYWSAASGILLIDGSHAGFAISPLGNAIAANDMPRLYTRAGAVGTPWQVTLLPVDPSATDGGAHALAADPVTGQVMLLGGTAKIPAAKRTIIVVPRLWIWQAGTSSWRMVALSTGSNGQGHVRQVSQNSLAVGSLGPLASSGRAGSTNQAALWQPDGLGGWTLVTLGPLGSAAEWINSAGTLIVGASGGVAVYWQQLSGGGWSAPIALPGGCRDARAVDDSGRIVADGCTSPSPAAVFVPPYSTATMIHLGGLGKQNLASVESMSPSGNWIVGNGVYWRPF